MDRETEILERLNQLENQVNAMDKSVDKLSSKLDDFLGKIYTAYLFIQKQAEEKYGIKTLRRKDGRVDDNAIIEMSKKGVTVEAQANILGVSKVAVYNHRKNLREQGRL